MFKVYNNFGVEFINICFVLVNEWILGDYNKRYLKKNCLFVFFIN